MTVQIVELIQRYLEKEHFSRYKIDIQAATGKKTDGYLGKIVFVTVSTTTKSGEEKQLDMVVKVSKESANLRKDLPVQEIFKKEIYIYGRLFPVFDKFQKEMGDKNLLDLLPKCYITQETNERELLVLEDLKVQGFDIWDRQRQMPYDYLKLILNAFGRWHAFSYALKRKKPDDFGKLVENNINIFSFWYSKIGMFDAVLEIYERARNASKLSSSENKKVELSRDDIKRAFVDLYSQDVPDQVILHGDCWNNNYMFKVAEDTPTEVRVLDWQCSGLGSPVMDLSYLIYSCVDTNRYRDVVEFLKVYHNSLSDCLDYFGCDTDEIFPYKKLIDHWKKYSVYGLIISSFILRFCLCENEDAPDFAEAVEQGKTVAEAFKFSMKNEELYFDRMRDNFLHYVENTN